MGTSDFDSYYTFAFVRNPFDRLASLYYFLKSWQGLPKTGFAERFGLYNHFQDFIDDRLWCTSHGLWAPQVTWLTRCKISQEIGVKFIGKIESFEEDLRTVLKVIAPDLKLDSNTVRNKSPRLDLFQWSRSSAQIVIERYEEDFRSFGYSIDPPIL